ncbi:MAG TPA: hypothetical protein VNJ01_03515 [Bacteriovoracaceae bacterium]|nr:hypothetical protein [Bacteriovoracaceae bacterium]
MFKITIVSLLLFTSNLYAQVFLPEFQDNEVKILYEHNYVIISHATRKWDEDDSSRAGVQALARFANLFRITSLAAVHEGATTDPREAGDYFVSQKDVNHVYVSGAGQHKIRYVQARNIFIAGGNLTLCLCETIRDIVRGARIPRQRPLNLYLVQDAIYDWDSSFDPITANTVDRFVASYILPDFLCPDQNWYNFPPVRLNKVKLAIYNENRLLKTYDLTPNDQVPLNQLSKTINIKIISSKNLQRAYAELIRK